MGVVWVSTGIKTCNGILRTTVRLRAPPPKKLMIKWLKTRISHKLSNFSKEKLKTFLKKNGLAFVVIVVGWEIVEDVIFPIIFGALGNYVHPAFYAGIPASLILCFHWLAIPILWGMWVKISNNSTKTTNYSEMECCENETD